MRPVDMTPKEKFLERHGIRACYQSGCRCDKCRQANREYERQRAKRRRGGWLGLVPAEPARLHLLELSKHGIGRRTVQDISGVATAILAAIRQGHKHNIRADTERRILRVTTDAANDARLVPAGPSLKLIRKLVREGFSRAEIARRLGYASPSLQIRSKRITMRFAHKIERFYRTVMVG